jgi:hypothetical protein
MAEQDSKGDEQKGLLHSLAIGDSTERVDALWRQIMVYKAFAESNLSDAKARRAQADAARETAEQEAAQATRTMCEGLKHEAESVKAEAARVLRLAEAEHAHARDATSEAEEARDRIVAEARHQAQEILNRSRAAAQQECTELRRHALEEIKAILGRVETIRAATDEELETQRIFADIARLKASTASLLVQPVDENDDAKGQEDSLFVLGATDPGTGDTGQHDATQEAPPAAVGAADVKESKPNGAKEPAQKADAAKGKGKNSRGS